MIANKRVDVRREPCPIPGCGSTARRLDRHIQSHSEVPLPVRQRALVGLKRKLMIMRLRELRTSNPPIPMVSSLDLEEKEQQQKEEDGILLFFSH